MRKAVLLLILTGCQSVPDSETIAYRQVSAEENARALKAIAECLAQPDCPGLLGEQLECGPFLWRQLDTPALSSVTTYWLPQGTEKVAWRGRRAGGPREVLVLWRAFTQQVSPDSLQTFRRLTQEEIRIYSTLVPGEIREPVFIAEGGGHKILLQLSAGKLTFLDDFRNVTIRD